VVQLARGDLPASRPTSNRHLLPLNEDIDHEHLPLDGWDLNQAKPTPGVLGQSDNCPPQVSFKV
jgi:hypothetical protein